MDITWTECLLPIIMEYRQFDTNDPLDGDEVERLCEILKAKINLHEGNITEEEYHKIVELSVFASNPPKNKEKE